VDALVGHLHETTLVDQLLERLTQGGSTDAERLGEVDLLDALARRSSPVSNARRIRVETSSRRVDETTTPPLRVTAGSGTGVSSVMQID
jgi:hypothetical protein